MPKRVPSLNSRAARTALFSDPVFNSLLASYYDTLYANLSEIDREKLAEWEQQQLNADTAEAEDAQTIAQRAAAREVVLMQYIRLWEARYKSFHDLVARQYRKLAQAFRTRDEQLTRQFMQGPRDETAFRYLLDAYRGLAQDGLQKGRRAHRIPDAIIGQRYDLILSRLKHLPEYGDEEKRADYLQDLLRALPVQDLPSRDEFLRWASLRQKPEMAREMV